MVFAEATNFVSGKICFTIYLLSDVPNGWLVVMLFDVTFKLM